MSNIILMFSKRIVVLSSHGCPEKCLWEKSLPEKCPRENCPLEISTPQKIATRKNPPPQENCPREIVPLDFCCFY